MLSFHVGRFLINLRRLLPTFECGNDREAGNAWPVRQNECSNFSIITNVASDERLTRMQEDTVRLWCFMLDHSNKLPK